MMKPTISAPPATIADAGLPGKVANRQASQNLDHYLRRQWRAALLFSGGLDSSLLLAAAARVLGPGLTAITFTGPHTMAGELAAAWALTRRLKVRHLVRAFDPLSLPEFQHNTLTRCYVCKKAIITQAWEIAAALGVQVLWDGTNVDDLADFRPGLKALKDQGVESPLLLAGLGKWRVGLPWYLVALLLPALVRLAAVSLDVLSGGSWPEFFHANAVPPGNPFVLIVPVFLAVFFQAGLAEEIGWRGYALPQLQTRYSALTASLILGILHAPWHFRPESMSILAPVIVPFWLLVIAMSIIWTWLYNNTQRSLFLAVLFHTASDVSDWIVPTLPGLTAATSSKPFIILAGLMWVVAVGIILFFGPRSFVRKPQQPQK